MLERLIHAAERAYSGISRLASHSSSRKGSSEGSLLGAPSQPISGHNGSKISAWHNASAGFPIILASIGASIKKCNMMRNVITSQTFYLEQTPRPRSRISFKDILQFQMSREPDWMTMEELLEVAADTEEKDKVLDRIKLLAQESLLVGWLNWKTLDLSRETLFGNEPDVDPQILNKLRFALPTAGLAQAFNPSSAIDLPEKQYRDFKVSMLNWSFCRALIMSPPMLVNKLKRSVSQAKIFLHAIRPVKLVFRANKLQKS